MSVIWLRKSRFVRSRPSTERLGQISGELVLPSNGSTVSDGKAAGGGQGFLKTRRARRTNRVDTNGFGNIL